MTRAISSTIVAAALCLSTTTSASAQNGEASDWELVSIPRAKTIAATVQFDNGITLITRCKDRQAFDVLISGLPDFPAKRRLLQVGIGEGAKMRDVAWISGADKSSAFSLFPMTLARDLMRGGTIQIRVPGQDERPATLYVMETEPSVAAIAETLTACNQPLIDPRDSRETETLEELPDDIEWVRRPFPSSEAISRVSTHLETYVTVSCLTAEGGTLADCRIESAHPFNADVNRLILDATRYGRLRLKESTDTPPANREIVYGVPITLS